MPQLTTTSIACKLRLVRWMPVWKPNSANHYIPCKPRPGLVPARPGAFFHVKKPSTTGQANGAPTPQPHRKKILQIWAKFACQAQKRLISIKPNDIDLAKSPTQKLIIEEVGGKFIQTRFTPATRVFVAITPIEQILCE